MDSPTTVRGWLKTLPDELRSKVTQNQHFFVDATCPTLFAAVTAHRNFYGSYTSEYAFWNGVLCHLNGIDGNNTRWAQGYTTAKAAFERQKTAIVPEPENEIRYHDTVVGTTNANIGDVVTFGLNKDEPDHQPAFMVIAPDDLAELQRKAAAYNELKAVIDRLDCEIQDLKKMFV